LLAHDVELTGDGGGKVPALARSLHGRSRVAHTLTNWLRALARFPQVSMRPVEVNGDPGAIYVDDQERILGVWALEIADGEIVGVRSIVNPDKLAHLGPVGDAVAILRSAR
jgi:RNA polymerase sigma-70 factor (ECF subfamily)